jgi:hypothetical protein
MRARSLLVLLLVLVHVLILVLVLVHVLLLEFEHMRRAARTCRLAPSKV